jgi:hypothetical protein
MANHRCAKSGNGVATRHVEKHSRNKSVSKMILLSYGFTFAVGLAVIILLIAAMTATWERLRDNRELKKLERERRSENR